MNERHVRIKICISLYVLLSFGGGSGSSADARSGHVFLFLPHREKVLAKFV